MSLKLHSDRHNIPAYLYFENIYLTDPVGGIVVEPMSVSDKDKYVIVFIAI